LKEVILTRVFKRGEVRNPPQSPFTKGGDLNGLGEEYGEFEERSPSENKFPFPLLRGRGIRG
jgi:hypothetical protein